MLKREREWRPHWRERKSLRGNFEILHHIIPTAALLPDLPSYLPTYQSISHSYAHSQSPLIDSLTPLSFSPPIILMHTRSSLSMSLSPYHSLSSKPLSLSFSLSHSYTHSLYVSLSDKALMFSQFWLLYTLPRRSSNLKNWRDAISFVPFLSALTWCTHWRMQWTSHGCLRRKFGLR